MLSSPSLTRCQLYLHENEPLEPTEVRRSLVFFAHSDILSDNTEFPSEEDIKLMADGKEPGFRTAEREQRRVKREQKMHQAALAAVQPLMQVGYGVADDDDMVDDAEELEYGAILSGLCMRPA